MSEHTYPQGSQLHLLGRAASQVIVHFGRHNIPVVIRLDVRRDVPPALFVHMQCVPAAHIVTRWWAFEWQRHFMAEPEDPRFGEWGFTLWCAESI